MKRAILITGITVLTLGTMAVTVMAHDRGPGKMGGGPRIDFQAADANSDGKLTPDELRAYGAARFALADTDGNGALSAQEMEAKIQSHMQERAGQRAGKGAARMIERRDANGDGELSLEEMGPKGGETRIFDHLDKDGDGAISTEEFAKLGEGRRGTHKRRGNGARD